MLEKNVQIFISENTLKFFICYGTRLRDHFMKYSMD